MNNLNRFSFPEQPTISAEQAEEYSLAAEKYYTSSLAYHNWDHASETMRGVEVISRKLQQKGIIAASGALAVAAAWHDAGYHENHITKGFLTKEDYSAFLLENFLEGKPVSESEKRLMLTAIKDTWAGHKSLRLPSSLILHRADIANIGGPTDEFVENLVKLRDEAEFTGGSGSNSWNSFLQGSDYFVRFTSAEHDFENLGHGIDAENTVLDVNDTPFSIAALKNLNELRSLMNK